MVDLKAEVQYLRNVLANESSLAPLLATISNAPGMKLQFPAKPDVVGGLQQQQQQTTSNGAGLCVHVVDNNVSVELCARCNRQARSVPNEWKVLSFCVLYCITTVLARELLYSTYSVLTHWPDRVFSFFLLSIDDLNCTLLCVHAKVHTRNRQFDDNTSAAAVIFEVLRVRFHSNLISHSHVCVHYSYFVQDRKTASKNSVLEEKMCVVPLVAAKNDWFLYLVWLWVSIS